MDDATSPGAGVHETCDAYVIDYARTSIVRGTPRSGRGGSA